ncbi:hypothetical protein [Vreelandella nigrificans]|uniref:Uncharacterized protein n=1 Tax=Vreelandella nigrificans TaxID=2042704 RepID=A0A2A4HFR3_9GAMM|nr:hypothetical protein [Halomonas nigrificans]PCF93522.1 hypothetical protein CPA45_21895 [Halomonas nigrificans]
MALKSLLMRAASAGRQAARKALDGVQQEGWSDGWHTQASTTESLRVLRDSAAGMAKSTAQTATTQEGWRRIARGAGKVAGGAAVVAGGVAQGVLHSSSASEDHEDVPDHLRYGPSSSDPGGSPYSSDPEH